MKKTFRNFVDISPWDKSGGSFWGLRRESARKLALVFIFVGALIADPPFSIIPNDWINFLLAGLMSTHLGLTFNAALLLTYSVIGPLLFLTGIYIYPFNSHLLFFGYVKKLQRFLRKQIKNPVSIAIGIIMFIIMHRIYAGWLL